MTTNDDKELEEFEAERKDETVADDLEVYDGAPDPDLEPQSLIEVQDNEVNADA